MELRSYLTMHSIPTQKFAEKLGVSFQTVHRYLHGERIPRADLAERIETATDGQVTASDFVKHYNRRQRAVPEAAV